MMRDPKTEPIPAPDPATPTVAAPAPMNLAAESMSCLAAEVWMRLVACTVAGLMLLQAAMLRRGDTERRAMADILVLEMLGVGEWQKSRNTTWVKYHFSSVPELC